MAGFFVVSLTATFVLVHVFIRCQQAGWELFLRREVCYMILLILSGHCVIEWTTRRWRKHTQTNNQTVDESREVKIFVYGNCVIEGMPRQWGPDKLPNNPPLGEPTEDVAACSTACTKKAYVKKEKRLRAIARAKEAMATDAANVKAHKARNTF